MDDAASAGLTLGLPLSRNVRFRFVRRFLIKLLWPVLQSQITANSQMHATLNTLVGDINAWRPRLDRIDGDLEHHSSVLSRHEASLNEVIEYRGRIDRVDAEFVLLAERVELANRQAFARHQDGMGSVRAELSELFRRVSEAEDAFPQLQRQIADLRIRLASADLLVREVKKSRPDLPDPQRIAALPSAFDELYGAFEDAFRGPEAVIKERVAVYLPDIAHAPEQMPVLDIGSGRGEWLTVLKEANIPAYGVEINQAYADRCQAKGLDVRLEDAVEHLKSLGEGSLRAVTAIQVVEHIEMDLLIELIDRAVVALQPGGVLIFETPNPENLTVGASTFYIDPTHQRPIPPALLAFLVDCRGMIDVEIRPLNRPELEMLKFPTIDQPWNNDIAQLINVINSRIYAAQDYAVVARRP